MKRYILNICTEDKEKKGKTFSPNDTKLSYFCLSISKKKDIYTFIFNRTRNLISTLSIYLGL